MSINLTPITQPALVSMDRAAYNGTLAALAASNPSALAELLMAATTKIVRYCRRDFAQTSYAEFYDGGGYPYQRLALKQFPVTDITRVATDPQTVLRITNTSPAVNQRATVETIGTVLRLKRVASAVSTTVDLDFGAYPTLTAISTAVNATAGSWSCAIQSGYDLYPSADLNPLQGAADARNSPACIEMHIEDLNMWTGACGGGCQQESGWRLDAGPGILDGFFPKGWQNIRVDYQAGFAVVPQAVQEACVLLTQDLVQSEQANRALTSGSLGPYKFAYAQDSTAMSKAVRDLLSEYVAHDKGILS